jgi:hypothetical protein
VDDQFVAVWANPLGALVMAFVADISTAATAAAIATVTTTVSFGHGC